MLFTDDIHAKFNTFIADKDSWPCNELAHLMLALSTKRAEQRSLISIIFFCHFTAPALDHMGGFDAVRSVYCSPGLERVHSYLQTKSVPKSKSTDPVSGKSVALAFSLWDRALFNHLVNQTEIRCLALKPARWLVSHDAGIWQAETLASGACSQQKRAH